MIPIIDTAVYNMAGLFFSLDCYDIAVGCYMIAVILYCVAKLYNFIQIQIFMDRFEINVAAF